MPGIPQFIGGTEDVRSGAASIVYDPSATTTYKYGPSFAAGTNALPSCYQWNNDGGVGIGNIDGCHYGVMQQWGGVTPGVRTITGFSQRGAYFQADHIHSYAVEVWRDDTTQYTLVASTGDIAADAGATGTMTLTKTLATPLSVTIESGQSYYVGLRFIRKTLSSGAPYVGRTNTIASAHTNFRFAVKAASWDGVSISKTDSAGNLYTWTDDEICLFNITYTSPCLKEQSISAIAAKTYIIARPTVAHVVKIQAMEVTDGNAMVALFHDFGLNGASATMETVELDSGNTVPGQDDIICNGKTVNLPSLSGNRQAGHYFDLLMSVYPQTATTAKHDLYFQNRKNVAGVALEVGVHSHAVKDSGTRGTRYTSVSTYQQRCVTFSGTFDETYHLSSLQVGTRPWWIIGDSQAIVNGATYRAPDTDGYGLMPTTLTKPRIWVMLGQSGQDLVGAAGIEALAFRSATPGDGDAIEGIGLNGTWAFSGIGLNDISGEGYSTDAAARGAVNKLMAGWASLLQYLLPSGEEIVIAGLPPYSAAGSHEAEGKAVRWYNRALFGLALAYRFVFYNPWIDMVEPGTENDLQPAFNAAYTLDAGRHYNPVGAAIVVPKFVSFVENANIDQRDAL